MTRRLTTGWRFPLVLVVLVLGLAPVSSPFTPTVALAQSGKTFTPAELLLRALACVRARGTR